MSDRSASLPDTRLRLVFESGLVLGAGKIALLEALKLKEGSSISAASRQTAISYRKTRQLIDALNSAFDTPVVISSRGRARAFGPLSPFSPHRLRELHAPTTLF